MKSKGRLAVVIWGIFLSGFYAGNTYLASSRLYSDKLESIERHRERLDPQTTEKGKTQINRHQLHALDGNHAVKVNVGIYIDRIVEISTKATGWTVDFYIWFKWRGSKLNPGKTFQVVDGELNKLTLLQDEMVDGVHYALYRATARFTKRFNVIRYPLDNHLLTIRVEDKIHPLSELQYIADADGASYSSRVEVPGYALTGAKLISKPHAYKTTRGDPRLPSDYQGIYSQITYGISIKRPDWGLYVKMFQGLFASVAIAFLAFVFNPASRERISLGVGAFFASVASSYVNLNELPGVGMMSLIDMANGLAMVTIFLTLLASVICTAISELPDGKTTAKLFDRVSLAIFITGFVGFNTSMALSAVV